MWRCRLIIISATVLVGPPGPPSAGQFPTGRGRCNLSQGEPLLNRTRGLMYNGPGRMGGTPVRRFGITLVVVTVPLAAANATAADLSPFSWHQVSGSGVAQLFDGGPAVSDSQSIAGAKSPRFSFDATDRTRVGSRGALATVHGESSIGVGEGGFGLRVMLDTAYVPSLNAGGDNPGGMAQGQISSVIEFLMPADQMVWGYQLRITDTNRFDGSTSVVMENVTQSQIILDVTSAVFPPVETILSGNIGDLIRLTTNMSGSGSTSPTSQKQYTSILSMTFLIPEPGTLWLLLVGAVALRAAPSSSPPSPAMA